MSRAGRARRAGVGGAGCGAGGGGGDARGGAAAAPSARKAQFSFKQRAGIMRPPLHSQMIIYITRSYVLCTQN